MATLFDKIDLSLEDRMETLCLTFIKDLKVVNTMRWNAIGAFKKGKFRSTYINNVITDVLAEFTPGKETFVVSILKSLKVIASNSKRIIDNDFYDIVRDEDNNPIDRIDVTDRILSNIEMAKCSIMSVDLTQYEDAIRLYKQIHETLKSF